MLPYLVKYALISIFLAGIALFAVALFNGLVMFGHIKDKYRLIGPLIWPIAFTEYAYTEAGLKYFRRFRKFLLLSILCGAAFFLILWALPDPEFWRQFM